MIPNFAVEGTKPHFRILVEFQELHIFGGSDGSDGDPFILEEREFPHRSATSQAIQKTCVIESEYTWQAFTIFMPSQRIHKIH